jgi:hypothetical protein
MAILDMAEQLGECTGHHCKKRSGDPAAQGRAFEPADDSRPLNRPQPDPG